MSQDQIPDRLKHKALELRSALVCGDITSIELLFIHNCPESQNVHNELRASAGIARDLVAALNDSISDQFIVTYKELGLNNIEEPYKSRDSEILVDDWLDVPATDYFEKHGNGWKAIVTTVPGDWIRQLYQIHRDRLFSANFRDYLGSTNRKGNINQEIKQTVASEPTNFWVYNNGVTALTHELRLDAESIRVHGISIINGAQTSGSLGESSDVSTKQAKVLCRIVESGPEGLVQNIIRYNNTQNEIKPADRRSNDDIQRRIKNDFDQYGIVYAHRRSATRTPRNAITAASVAPALCAFHGDPQTTYRNAKDIFNVDEIYRKFFRPNITIEHIFLITTLSSALDSIKNSLKEYKTSQTATKIQEQEYEVLRYSPSKHFVLYIVGSLIEEIMGRRVMDTYEWKCRPEVVNSQAQTITRAWADTLGALLPQIALITQRNGTVYDVQRSFQGSVAVVNELQALLTSLGTEFGSRFDLLRAKTTI